MIGVDLPTPNHVLVVGAHPDDAEFGCGATLAKWADAGATVHLLICTDGAKGTWDPDVDPADLTALRQVEARTAAKALGATGEVVFLGWPDGELTSGLRQRWQVSYWIRRLCPDVVLGHDPWRRYRLHPDHRNAGFLVVDGLVAARDPLFFPEQAIPHHRPDALLLFEADELDHVEVVAETHVARKLDAMEAHRSQLRSTMFVDEEAEDTGEQLAAFRRRVRDRLADNGALADAPYGEAFKLLRT
jgi:LmbE family N-acetylglucosaminyl deacetylase